MTFMCKIVQMYTIALSVTEDEQQRHKMKSNDLR